MKRHPILKQPVAGFSLIELIVAVLFFSALSAIAIPSYLSLINQQRLSQAQNNITNALRDAQSNAKKERISWQACFRDYGGTVAAAIQRVPTAGANCDPTTANWNPLIGLNDSKLITIYSTTNLPTDANGNYTVQYQADGTINNLNPPQKINIALRNQSNNNLRCVYVQTVLGSLNFGQIGQDINCN